MGWSNSHIIGEVFEAFADVDCRDFATRKEFYKRVIEVFEEHDFDTLDEIVDEDSDKALKAAVREIHPDWEF